jgi:hypothetical protein
MSQTPKSTLEKVLGFAGNALIALGVAGLFVSRSSNQEPGMYISGASISIGLLVLATHWAAKRNRREDAGERITLYEQHLPKIANFTAALLILAILSSSGILKELIT